jgi:hypothetical protein
MSGLTEDFLKQSIKGVTDSYVAGMQAAQAMSPDRLLLNAIVAAYDKALTYENTTIPTPLMCAIEAARK